MKNVKPRAYLSGLNINVMHFGLEAITGLLKRLGNPHNDYPAILIGGTNGKGSTAAMTASILQKAGYRTGLYTSPHLIDVRERIRIGSRKISEQKFGIMISEVRAQVRMPVTYFEALTAAAFLYFQQQKVDIAVLEVGLGGRLDATNVCRPLVSVITSIGLEHTAYLGKTLTAIAQEKAGIIRPSSICITGVTRKKVLQVLEDCCLRKKTILYRLGQDIQVATRTNGMIGYHGIGMHWEHLEPALRGPHQTANAALALAAIEVIADKGFPVSKRAVYEGLKNTRWEARMEMLSSRPAFILDGAHNPDGIHMLVRTLRKDYPRKRLILIFAALKDKDYKTMLKKILPLASQVIMPEIKTDRAVAAGDLAFMAQNMGMHVQVTNDVNEAINLALKLAKRDDLICAAGSLYLAGEIKQLFPRMHSCGKA